MTVFFTVSTEELKAVLDGVPMNHPQVMQFINEFLQEQWRRYRTAHPATKINLEVSLASMKSLAELQALRDKAKKPNGDPYRRAG